MIYALFGYVLFATIALMLANQYGEERWPRWGRRAWVVAIVPFFLAWAPIAILGGNLILVRATPEVLRKVWRL